jgi:hypothetical protein
VFDAELHTPEQHWPSSTHTPLFGLQHRLPTHWFTPQQSASVEHATWVFG